MFNENHLKPELERKRKGYTEHMGYIMVRKPSHPYSWENGYMKLHRLIMEVELGRYLKPDEIVHHIDNDKKNNDINNLKLVDAATHRRIHNKENKLYESKYDLKKIRKLYESGKSTREIAEMVGISKSTVGYYVKKWNISRTEKSGKIHKDNPLNKRQITDEEIKEINSMKKSGATVKEIIKTTGYSRYTIYKYLSKELIS